MTQRDVTSWLPNLLGPTDFQVNSAPQSVPKRSTVNLVGTIKVTDNPANDSTDIQISGSGLQVADIVDFGGVGDGTTDNTAAMVLAIADLAPNGVIYFPSGTFRFSSTQSWDANVWFGHGSAITVDATKTVTIEGSIDANEYQQIFEGAGNVLLRTATKVSVCWFGADPDSNFVVGTNAAAIRLALNSVYTGTSSGDGTINAVVFAPAGTYELEKPISINASNLAFRGEGRTATFLQARAGYQGPAIVLSDGAPLTQHLNDYDTTLASCSIGDGGSGAPWLPLSRYGTCWALNGKAGFSLDMICKTSTTQTGTTKILSHSGTGPDGSVFSPDSTFQIWAVAADLGVSNTNLELWFELTTSSGTVIAKTNGGVWLTDGSWYQFRFDYDGSAMRIFVNGVAQTLQSSGTSIAQTGTLVTKLTQAVWLGYGQGSGFGGTVLTYNVPDGLRMACLRLKHVSQGSSNFTPPTGKYPEDADTKFLMDFDVVDADGGLTFARQWSDVLGMQNAWIPNVNVGAQIGGNEVSDLQIDSFGGPAIDSIATPLSTYKQLLCRAQSGINLWENSYFACVRDCALTGGTSWGVGLHLGEASNFVDVHNCSANGFTVDLYSESIFSTSGANYLINAQYSVVYLQGCYQAELSGSNFISDEGSPYHNTFGVVAKGCGTLRFSGVLFGLQAYNDQYQVWVNNSTRPISEDGASRVKFDHCTFATLLTGVSAIKVSTTEAIDSVVIDGCDRGVAGVPYLTVDSDSFAKITVWPYENERLPITLSDSDTTLTNDQWAYGKLVLSGTLTADRNLVVPTLDNYTREIENLTAHALLVKTSGGTGVYIPPGQTGAVSCDGTNVILDWLQGTTVRTITSGSSSTANNWDEFISINKSGVYNLTTPPNPVRGQPLLVNDELGDAGTNTKTVTANVGQTIGNAATATITVNGGKIAACWNPDTSNWML